tara:strand:- start:1846 stop:3318 length:1473 start_codon:yes stop_codon:yes gene_type:complete
LEQGSVLILFFFISLLVLIYFATDFLIKDTVIVEKVALSVPFALGILSFVIHYAFLFKLELRNSSYYLLSVFVLILLGMALKKSKSTLTIKKLTHSRNLSKVLLFLSPLLLSSFVFSIYYPTLMPDGIVYENTATALYYTKDLTNPNVNTPHPPMVPLTFLIMMLLGVGYGKIVFPLYYLLFVIIYYFRISNAVKDKTICILSTLVVGTTPLIWWHSFLFGNNLIPGFYYSIGVLLWFETLKQQPEGRGYAILGGFFLGFSSWCRVEFLWYSLVPVLLTIFFNRGQKKSNMFISLCLPIVLVNLWVPITLLTLPHYYINYKKEFSLLLLSLILLTLTYFFDVSKLVKYFKKKINWFLPGIIISIFSVSSNYAGSITQGITNTITSIMRMIMTFLYYPGGSLLLILIFGFKSILLTRVQKYMVFTIITYLSIHLLIYSTGAKYLDISKYLELFIFSPGFMVNSSGVREVIAFFPILMFLLGTCHDKLLEKS